MKKKILIACVLLFVSVFAILVLSYLGVERTISRPFNAADTRTVRFEIKAGQGAEAIAAELEKAGLIAGSDYLKIYLFEHEMGGDLKAGTYELSPSMTIAEMVEIFRTGARGLKANETQVVIAEGFSDDQILEALKKAGTVSAEESFAKLDLDLSRYAFLADKPAAAGLEGYLFPDTYNLFKDSALTDVAAKMLSNFDEKLTPEMRAEISRQNKTIFETLIMASIVEKESPDKEDMPDIAGVFYNRLAVNMPLQSDATINYVTNGGRPMPTGEDLETDSPFNTYKNPGLPPAPICNPGIEAIKAAINPRKNDYFYFLMPQDGTGTTIFSKTYDEHLRNKAKYLR